MRLGGQQFIQIAELEFTLWPLVDTGLALFNQEGHQFYLLHPRTGE